MIWPAVDVLIFPLEYIFGVPVNDGKVKDTYNYNI